MRDPYEAPEASSHLADAPEDAAAVRLALLPREGVVRMSVVPFTLVGAVLLGLGGYGLVVAGGHGVWELLGMLVAGLALVALGQGVRALKAWSRPPAIAVASLACAGALAALILRSGRPEPLYAAVFLLSFMPLLGLAPKASAFVFSPEYAEVVRRTPELRYRAPPAVVISIAFLIVVVIAVVWRSVEGHGGRWI